MGRWTQAAPRGAEHRDRAQINDVDLDFATPNRRLHLMAKETGDWKMTFREKDRTDAVDPTVDVDRYLDAEALSKFSKWIEDAS